MPYFRQLALTAAISFAAIWLWVATMPMAYMDPEYASWRAKRAMLAQCRLGDAIILGDSRAAAGIMPRRLPVPVTNLAVGGGESIEAFAALKRALACPRVPRLAIVSFDAVHFTNVDLFWERSVRYGFMSTDDLAELRAVTRRTGDRSVYDARHANGLPPVVRDILYEIDFPAFDFSNLLHAGGFLRWWGNREAMRATIAAGGQYFFGTAAGSSDVAAEAHTDSFRPLPVLDIYFDQLLALLEKRGIETWFVALPVNNATWDGVRPALRAGFAAYLAAYERRYPHFHVVGDGFPHWPNRYFGDQFSHLNPEGAERFSALLAQRLQEAPPRTQNEAQNGWFSGTDADASASVRPISKRGS